MLLNDPTYVEAARVLAERTIKQGGSSVPSRIAWAFSMVLDRKPKPEESAVLAELYARHLASMRAIKASGRKLIVDRGHAPVPRDRPGGIGARGPAVDG